MVSLEDHLLAIVRPGLHPWLCSGLPVQRAGQVGALFHETGRAKGSGTASLRVSHHRSPFQSTHLTVLNGGGRIEAVCTC
jgi:hypothetical protein